MGRASVKCSSYLYSYLFSNYSQIIYFQIILKFFTQKTGRPFLKPTSFFVFIVFSVQQLFTQTITSTESPNHAPVDVSDIPVTLSDTSNVPTASAQTPHTSTTVNANPFDSQTSLSETRSTTTEVVYTQGKIQFTFTTPTSTFAPRSDITKIMQMADLYECQNQIQKSMFQNIALNRLVENDHTMWNAITYVKGKMQHVQQIIRPQYVPLQQP